MTMLVVAAIALLSATVSPLLRLESAAAAASIFIQQASNAGGQQAAIAKGQQAANARAHSCCHHVSVQHLAPLDLKLHVK